MSNVPPENPKGRIIPLHGSRNIRNQGIIPVITENNPNVCRQSIICVWKLEKKFNSKMGKQMFLFLGVPVSDE